MKNKQLFVLDCHFLFVVFFHLSFLLCISCLDFWLCVLVCAFFSFLLSVIYNAWKRTFAELYTQKHTHIDKMYMWGPPFCIPIARILGILLLLFGMFFILYRCCCWCCFCSFILTRTISQYNICASVGLSEYVCVSVFIGASTLLLLLLLLLLPMLLAFFNFVCLIFLFLVRYFIWVGFFLLLPWFVVVQSTILLQFFLHVLFLLHVAYDDCTASIRTVLYCMVCFFFLLST